MPERDSRGRYKRPSRVRFTSFGKGDAPLAHADTKDEAIRLGSERGRVVYVVKRERDYPFRHLHSWTLEPLDAARRRKA